MAGQIQTARQNVLREKLSGPCAMPQLLFEHLSAQDTVSLLTEVLGATTKPQRSGLRIGAKLLFAPLLVCFVVVAHLQWGIRLGSRDSWVLLYWMVIPSLFATIRSLKNQPHHSTENRILMLNSSRVLVETFGQLQHSRELPISLEAARQIGQLETQEATQAWEKALYSLLTRLLPRLTDDETRVLTIDQRAFLRALLYQDLPVDVIVAILLTLGTAGDRTGLEVAKRFATNPDERVREALSEYHTMMRKRG